MHAVIPDAASFFSRQGEASGCSENPTCSDQGNGSCELSINQTTPSAQMGKPTQRGELASAKPEEVLASSPGVRLFSAWNGEQWCGWKRFSSRVRELGIGYSSIFTPMLHGLIEPCACDPWGPPSLTTVQSLTIIVGLVMNTYYCLQGTPLLLGNWQPSRPAPSSSLFQALLRGHGASSTQKHQATNF